MATSNILAASNILVASNCLVAYVVICAESYFYFVPLWYELPETKRFIYVCQKQAESFYSIEKKQVFERFVIETIVILILRYMIRSADRILEQFMCKKTKKSK